MNRKTPKEIADSFPVARIGNGFINEENTLLAMREYAAQEMAAIMEWAGYNGYMYNEKMKKWEYMYDELENYYTTQELITKFYEEQ